MELCPNCNGNLGANEIKSLSFGLDPGITVADDKDEPAEFTEPVSKAYEDAEPASLLALIGERLLVQLPETES